MPRRADFVEAVIHHEGLVTGQTPARIPDDMEEWPFDSYLGERVVKGNKPKGRERFVFLQNPDAVSKVVDKQFDRYREFPQKFGLQPNPTIEQAIRVFDQTGADGKIQFLKQMQFDVSQPLGSLFGEES